MAKGEYQEEKMRNYKDLIILEKLPEHIAIIMDGNGRWAKQQGQPRAIGHAAGVESVKDIVEGAAEIGLKYLTLYTFSVENWNRPDDEVNALMELLVDAVLRETPTLIKNNIRLETIGEISSLPVKCQEQLAKAKEVTRACSGLTLILALSYGSRNEIINAVKRVAEKVKLGEIDINDINDNIFANELDTKNVADPELLIRTSGEQRVSNYLLWQIAYTEFYFTEKLWPDFKRNDLFEAIVNYQHRERRFGCISEQLNTVE